MSDLIKREDAIKAVEERSFAVRDSYTVKAILRNVPSADRPQEWIPCSERLPSVKDYVSDMVMWCTDKSIVGVGWYYERTKSWGAVDDTFMSIVGDVVAWMPLPEPWKGADDDEV